MGSRHFFSFVNEYGTQRILRGILRAFKRKPDSSSLVVVGVWVIAVVREGLVEQQEDIISLYLLVTFFSKWSSTSDCEVIPDTNLPHSNLWFKCAVSFHLERSALSSTWCCSVENLTRSLCRTHLFSKAAIALLRSLPCLGLFWHLRVKVCRCS